MIEIILLEKLLSWATYLKRAGIFIGVLLVASACIGSGSKSLPAPAVIENPVDEQKTPLVEEPEPTRAVIEEVQEQPPAGPTRFPAEKYADLEIVTLLPRDAIPAIDNPQFLTIPEADEFYDEDELVMGVSFGGEARAYSVPLLSNHEIVNDTVGGRKIAVTW